MRTDVHLDLLKHVDVASPCAARWEDMTGDEKSRHCAQCNLRVHNLSAMTRAEAEAFLAPRAGPDAGRVCVRFYRRADGTILTRDCPVGLAAVRAKAGAMARRVAAGVALVLSGGLLLGMQGRGGRGERLGAMEPFASLRAWLNPGAAVVSPAIMGKRAWTGGVMMPLPSAPNSAPATPPVCAETGATE